MVYREDVPFWTAKEAAHSTQLSAWEHLQLFFFLNHSFDRNKAGQFLLDKLAGLGPDESREKYLRSIIDDMRSLAQKYLVNLTLSEVSRSTPISTNAISALEKRQNGICHISGESQDLQPIHIVSPSVLNDDDLMPGTRLRELLDICVSPKVTDKLFSFMRSSESVSDDLKNLWLMSPAVAAAFREGHISIYKNDYDPKRLFWILRTTIPGNYNVPGVARNRKFSSMPSTPDDTQLPLPEGFLLDIHCHVSEFLYFLDIEKQIQAGWEIEDEYTGPCRSFRGRILRALFSMLPHFLRLKIMKLIVWAQDRWCPPYNKSLRHLPFGLCLKIGRRVMENEANALRLVEQHTQVPAPQLIGFAKDGLGDGYLLMSRVPGVPVDEFYYRMTYEERAQLTKDLKGHILQYRQIRNTSPYLICNTLGGPTYDHRTDTGEVWGPYRTKDEFTNMLTEGLEDLRHEPPLSALYKKRHRIFFTHSDLHYSNLFIHKGRLCGIVDWECASFKPEYWEFTRAVWSFMADRQREQNLRLAFDENYQEELEAERLIWSKNPVY